jgi:hypothetical protein
MSLSSLTMRSRRGEALWESLIMLSDSLKQMLRPYSPLQEHHNADVSRAIGPQF